MSVTWKSTAGPMTIAGVPSSIGTPVTAVIATLDEVDHTGDTYRPGAFWPSGTQLISSWDHSSVIGFGLPVGSGVIVEQKNLAVFRGLLWTEMVAAQDVAAMLRRRGASQQWSYAYEIIEAGQIYYRGREVQQLRAVDAYEVSPVRRAAGTGTATLSVGDQAAKVLAEAHAHALDHQAREELMRAHVRLVALDLEMSR